VILGHAATLQGAQAPTSAPAAAPLGIGDLVRSLRTRGLHFTEAHVSTALSAPIPGLTAKAPSRVAAALTITAATARTAAPVPALSTTAKAPQQAPCVAAATPAATTPVSTPVFSTIAKAPNRVGAAFASPATTSAATVAASAAVAAATAQVQRVAGVGAAFSAPVPDLTAKAPNRVGVALTITATARTADAAHVPASAPANARVLQQATRVAAAAATPAAATAAELLGAGTKGGGSHGESTLAAAAAAGPPTFKTCRKRASPSEPVALSSEGGADLGLRRVRQRRGVGALLLRSLLGTTSARGQLQGHRRFARRKTP